MSKRGAEASWIESRKRWQINVQKDGKRKTLVSGTPGRRGKHEAEAKADEWLRSQTDDLPFDEAWEIYLADATKRTGTGNARNLESFGRLYLKPIIAHRRLSALTPMDFQRCIDAMADKGLSKKSMSNLRATLVGFAEFCRRNRWGIQIVAGDLKIDPTARGTSRTCLQPEDIRKVFAEDWVIDHGKRKPAHYIHAWRLMILTGMRRGEACGLQWQDIDGRVLHIHRAINEQNEITPGKNENAQRWVALSDRALVVLADQREYLRQAGIISPWVFPAEKTGEHTVPAYMYDRWQVYRKQKGIKGSLHEIRHTFISAVKSDMPIALLKEQVGHSADTDSIGIYGHRIDGDLDKISTVIDNVFERILE